MLIAKVRKHWDNHRLKKQNQPTYVDVYSIDSETKKREGYFTRYWKRPGSDRYGVMHQCFYENGKKQGIELTYSMECPQYSFFFNLIEVSNYTNGKLNGHSIRYSPKTHKPTAFTTYRDSRIVYVHAMTDDVDVFDIKFVEYINKKRNNQLADIFCFTKVDGIKFTKDRYRKFNSKKIGKRVSKTVVDNKVVVTRDNEYYVGIWCKGYRFNPDTNITQTRELYTSVFTDFVSAHLNIDNNNSRFIKEKTFSPAGKLMHSSTLLCRNGTSFSYVGHQKLASGDKFIAIGNLSCPTVSLTLSSDEFMNDEDQKLLYAYLLVHTC